MLSRVSLADTRQLLRDAFECDWRYVKLPRAVSLDERKHIRNVLYRAYAKLKVRVFATATGCHGGAAYPAITRIARLMRARTSTSTTHPAWGAIPSVSD